MKLKERLAKLIDLKSIITLLMVVTLIALMFSDIDMDGDIKTLFCTTFGMVITYYFTKSSREE